MREKGRRMGWALFTAVVVAEAALTACGGDTQNSGGACGIAGCGGDIAGMWMVTDMCVAGTASTGVAACDAVAASALATAKVTPNGTTVTFSNGSYTINGTPQVAAHYDFTNACLMAQGGTASDSTCNTIQSNLVNKGFTGTCRLSGSACACDVTQNIPVTQTGTYRVSGNTLVFDQDSAGSPFCVQGNTAKMSSPGGMDFSGSFTMSRM